MLKILGSSRVLAVIFFGLLLTTTLSGQSDQQYVGRYDAFGGFSYFATPNLNLYQRGFNGEFGVNVRRWVALGGDFSVVTGTSSLVPKELNQATLAKLAPLQPLLPPGYNLYVPFDSTTYTYSAGPQINIRKWKPVMFFVRPALGAMHQVVKAKPVDPIQQAIVSGLVPGGKKTDTVVFYGFGWGWDIRFSDRFAMRFGFDYVHTNLMDGLLKEGQNTIRMSVGPTVRWGKNVEK